MAEAEPPPTRSDARHNREALLIAAEDVFTRLGTDAPLQAICQQAGVGRGTLYRHFPTREHLFVALMRERVEELDLRARTLLDAPDTASSLVEWLRLYDRSATDYPGMSAQVGGGLADSTSPVEPLCRPMKRNFAKLFARAQEEGAVRTDISAVQVLTLVGALPKDPATGRTVTPYLDVVINGLLRSDHK
ncbi:TetR/AcrR family transcriptional regulator [Streptomyces sp. NPDC089424]|uniref:TetR/AcrR family transcriptional regulator n=1 Tax=Streptomyces sp. NPDC089424 TaxID=3365917 RepID=UPI0037F24D9C